MQHAIQVALARELLQHLDAGTTTLADEVMRNPVDVYTDPARLEREWSMIRGAPQFFGLSCRLPSPGSYFTDDETGIPVLFVRGEDGRVRAFLNVCRHRGSRVASGEGTGRRTFACPYHGWTYDCRGRLAGVPERESFAGVDLSRRHLVELPALECNGMLWAALDASAGLDPDRFLAGLAPELASYRFGGYVHYTRRKLVRRMNWKMVIDTFLESYHFAVLHPGTVHPLFFHNVGLFDPFGPHLREVFPRRTITELRERPESDWDLIAHTIVIYVLFPSTVLVMQRDHVEIWRVFPDSNQVRRERHSPGFLHPRAGRNGKRAASLGPESRPRSSYRRRGGLSHRRRDPVRLSRRRAGRDSLRTQRTGPPALATHRIRGALPAALSGPVIEQKRPRPELASQPVQVAQDSPSRRSTPHPSEGLAAEISPGRRLLLLLFTHE